MLSPKSFELRKKNIIVSIYGFPFIGDIPFSIKTKPSLIQKTSFYPENNYNKYTSFP